MASPNSVQCRPVPVTIIFPLKSPTNFSDDFFSLDSRLYSKGYIHGAPRLWRRPSAHSSVVQLHCTFSGQRAINRWQKDPEIRRFIERKIADGMVGCPKVIRCDDLFIATHDIRVCQCRSPRGYLLYGRDDDEEGGALICFDCGGGVPDYILDRYDPEIDVEGWAYVYEKIHWIWMATRELEGWALRQLRSPRSEINKSGRSIAKRLERVLKKPVFYNLFVEANKVRSSDARIVKACPTCGREGVSIGWSYPPLICKRCRVAY